MKFIFILFLYVFFLNFFIINSKKRHKDKNKNKNRNRNKNENKPTIKMKLNEDNFIFTNRFCFIPHFYDEKSDNIVHKCYNKFNTLPKVSVVSAVYNKELFVPQLIKGTQIQSLKDVEIIIVDDGSNDRSVNITNYYMKYDPRITLIKNKKNRGILYTKSTGFIKSKGMYIKSVDGDDMLCIKDMLKNLFIFAMEFDADIIAHRQFIGYYDGNYYDTKVKKVEKLFYRKLEPEKLDLLYFNEKNQMIINGWIISNLFISRRVYRNAIETIKGKYNKYLLHLDDVVVGNYIYKTANVFLEMNIEGYYVLKNSLSESQQKFTKKRIEIIVENSLFAAETFYEKSKNNFNDLKSSFFVFCDCIFNFNEFFITNLSDELNIKIKEFAKKLFINKSSYFLSLYLKNKCIHKFKIKYLL